MFTGICDFKKRELIPRKNIFLGPLCNYRSSVFSYVCPACGRPFMRDYSDFRIHPRDPNLTATLFHDPFWARIWLIFFISSFLFLWHCFFREIRRSGIPGSLLMGYDPLTRVEIVPVKVWGFSSFLPGNLQTHTLYGCRHATFISYRCLPLIVCLKA
jgi:hypothetical protein